MRVEVRLIEHEHRLRDKQAKDTKGSNQAQVKMSAAAAPSSEEAEDENPIKKIEAMVNKLSHQVNNMQSELKTLKQREQGRDSKQDPSSQGNRGVQKHEGNSSKGGPDKKDGETRSQGKAREPFTCYKCGGQGHLKRDCPSKTVPTCWDCKEVGHTKYNCPHAQDLNGNKPLSGGRQ